MYTFPRVSLLFQSIQLAKLCNFYTDIWQLIHIQVELICEMYSMLLCIFQTCPWVMNSSESENVPTFFSSFQDSSELMMTMSHLGDPRNAFLIYFPIAYCLHRPTGLQLLWLASLSEWINALLKWHVLTNLTTCVHIYC